ncbi:hypothetical protein AA0121_g4527 [Alternaria tenuissima]|nr:hypothetical protein AA0121_g4527 [Alternaria tenuissima]
MRNSGTDQPAALIAAINVTHSRLPGWIAFGLPLLSDAVTTS